MWLLLLLVTMPIIFIHLFLKNKAAKARNPPGPPGLPFIGNLHQIYSSNNLHEFLWQLSNKYGPLMHFKLGSVPLVVVSSAKLAKEVLKTQDHSFCNRPNFVGQNRLSYNNLDIAFSPYCYYWRELRKISVSHLLSLRVVQSFHPILDEEISRLVAKITDLASTSQVINLTQCVTFFTTNLICRVAFGKRYDEEEFEGRRLHELPREAQAMLTGFFMSDYFPGFSWVDRLSGLISRLENNFKRLDEFYQELIEEHLHPHRRLIDEDDDDDIIDVLIKLKERESYSIDLNWDNIKALLMNIFIAGADTNAVAIIWTMTVLMKAPKEMYKVQAEIRELTGRKGRVDEDDLEKLPYLKAVINETLRLCPPGPLLVRATVEKCILEDYEIKPKSLVYVNVWAIARDPEYWENPNEFLPERFLHGNIDVRGQDFGMIPFGSGRRMCPGMFLGLATVRLTVANLLYCFDWELPPGIKPQDIDMDVLPGLSQHKKNALYLVPRKHI